MDPTLYRYFRQALAGARPRVPPEATVPAHAPLPVLIHAHPRGAVPPGRLEDGLVALEGDGVVLHALAGIVQPDGSLGDLPLDRVEWARRLSYRHLKREGCLELFGIPIVPAYEYLELLEACARPRTNG
jgi:hypothetical protein